MLPRDTKLISADDHIIEPPHLWHDRLPAKYRSVGPRVVEEDDGRQRWAYEDQRISIERGVVRSLPEFEHLDWRVWARYDEMHPSSYEPNARLQAMDEDGVWGTVSFPQFARMARFMRGQDGHLKKLCVEAYNDFLVEEWCAADPARLHGIGILPLWDVELAAAEVRRMAPRGIKAFAFSENPTVLGLPSIHTDHWDPLWSAIDANDVPICMHIGSSTKMITSSADAPIEVTLALSGVNSMVACVDWLFAGIFSRFPNLRIVLSESGAGWLPYVLERSDRVVEQFGLADRLGRTPRELFAQHVFVCIVTDYFALRSLGDVPEDNLLWETDFPHTDSTFPHSRRVFEDAVAPLSDDVCVKVGSENARRVFKI